MQVVPVAESQLDRGRDTGRKIVGSEVDGIRNSQLERFVIR